MPRIQANIGRMLAVVDEAEAEQVAPLRLAEIAKNREPDCVLH